MTHALSPRVLGLSALGLGACRAAPPVQPDPADGFQSRFEVDPSDWQSRARNRYFVLEPGWRLVLRNPARELELVIRVLDETRLLGGVETRVVEERLTRAGVPVEISRNDFAASKRTGNVYCFGEDVDVYEHGRLASHEGSWHAGEHGARFALAMPGEARAGQRFYLALAPGVALDRCELRSAAASIQTPAGSFERCLDAEETTPLEPGERESKIFAPDVGLVQDEGLLLCEYGFAEPGG